MQTQFVGKSVCITSRLSRLSRGLHEHKGLQSRNGQRMKPRAHNSEDYSSKENGRFLGKLLQHVPALLASGALLMNPLLMDNMAQATTLSPDEQRTVKLFKRNTATVVNITNLGMRQDAFTLDIMEMPQGAGSGVVWDKEGHLVTNFHVIKQASEVQVTLSSGEQSIAKVVGIDAEKDVAVLQIDKKDKAKLIPVTIGSSADLAVGQKVFAIGNPFGLDHTLTTGVISGIGREITSTTGDRALQDVIQTDAAINPGNSGGPLLDSSGQLIGVNTAIISPTGASNGVGFAIPVDIVKSSVDQIVKYGKVIRPFIGISFAQDRSLEELGVRGILVLRTQDGSPAAKAGLRGTSRDEYGRLQLGDVVIGLNGSEVKNATDLYRALDKCKVGDIVDVEVLREKSPEHIQIELEANS